MPPSTAVPGEAGPRDSLPPAVICSERGRKAPRTEMVAARHIQDSSPRTVSVYYQQGSGPCCLGRAVGGPTRFRIRADGGWGGASEV